MKRRAMTSLALMATALVAEHATAKGVYHRLRAHIEAAPKIVTVRDGARVVATIRGEAIQPNGRPLRLITQRVSRQGLSVTVERRYTDPGGARIKSRITIVRLASGDLDLRITLGADRPVAVRLAPMFAASAAVVPFSLDRTLRLATEQSDATSRSPLPVLGLADGQRVYFVASGATWDYPLPGRATPGLSISGRAFAAPSVGSADAPVRLVPRAAQSWRTIIGRAPDAPPTDRRYAAALGAQVAIAADEGGLGFRSITGDLRRAAADRFGAIAFATAYWSRITSADGHRSVTPAPHYAPGTWMRDSFWTILGLANTRLERDTERMILDNYARVIPRTGPFAGRVPLLIAAPGTVAFDDESGLYFLIRMERDARRLGIAPDVDVARLVLRYILTRQVEGARFTTAGAEPFNGHPFSPNGWLDGFHYQRGDMITANQGLFVLALKASARLGLEVPAGLYDRALAVYRQSYDPALGYMRWLDSRDYRSPDVLIPEALSLYLWDEPLLSDQTVRATFAAQVWSDYGMRVLTTRDGGWVSSGEFLNTTNGGRAAEPAGWYQNGGSWLLWEYLAAYAAWRHGDPQACAAMRRSIAAEVAVEPISKEFKLTRVDAELDAVDPGGNRLVGSTDNARQGYGWNAAIYAFQRDVKAGGMACK